MTIPVKIIKKPKKGAAGTAAGGFATIGNGDKVEIGDIRNTLSSVQNIIDSLSNVLIPVDSAGVRVDWGSPALWAVKSVKGFYSEEFVSARGLNANGGSGPVGASYLYDLLDAGINNPVSGQALIYDGSKWVNQALQTGLDEQALGDYLSTNNYAKKSDIPSLAGYATETWVQQKGYLTQHQPLTDYLKKTEAASTYVAQVAGKGLSTNDFTNALLTKLNGIEAGANKYVHPAGGADTTITAAPGNVLSAIIVNNLGHVSSVESKTLAAGDIPSLAISKITGLQTALDNKLDKSAFDELFEKVNIGTASAPVYAIKAKFGLYTEQFLSARGQNPNGAGGAGVTLLSALNDVELSNLSGGQALVYNGTKWVNQAIQTGLDEAALGMYLTANNYAKKSDIPSLTGYATQTWVQQQGYLTAHQTIRTLTIQKNGTAVGTFNPTGSTNTTLNITDVASASTLSSHTGNTTVHITAAERTKWNNVVTDFAAITGTDSDTIINKWEEVVAFLDTYTEADTLAGLLNNKADKTQLGSYYTKTDADNRFVNVTGDTMSGRLTVSTNIDSLAYFNRPDGKEPFIYLQRNGANKAAFTHRSEDYGASIYNAMCGKYLGITDAGVPHFHGNKIWHAGNDGSGSRLDADLLDGFHANGLFTALTRTGEKNNTLSLTIGGTTKSVAIYPQAQWGNMYVEKTDNRGRAVVLLIADITAWKGSTASASHYGFVGRVTESRSKGYMGEKIADVICRCGYADQNATSCIHLRSSNVNQVTPRVILYNGKYYLGLEVFNSGHSVVLEGYFYNYLQTFTQLSRDANGALPSGATDVTSSYTSYVYSQDYVTAALRFIDASAYKAWGQTFFEGGKPKAVDGAMTINYTGETGIALYRKEGGGGAFIRFYNNNQSTNFYRVGMYAAGHFGIGYNGTDAISVLTNRLVGIGTKTPAYTLDVNGTVRATNIKIGDVVISYDSTNKGLKISGGGLYSESYISARGVNSAGGSAGSGLIQKVYGSSSLGGSFSDSTLTDTFNAYTINAINNRLKTVETGGAMTVTTTGSGNAITAISKSGTTITATKGATFLTQHQSLANYYTKSEVDAKDKRLTTYYASRPASANVNFGNNAGLYTFLATSSMTTGKPANDAHILHMEWDNSLAWAAQMAVPTTGNIQWRAQSGTAWQAWRTLLDSGNTYLSGGVITINGASITPLTSHQTLDYLNIKDVRSATRLPSYFGAHKASFWFNNTGTPNREWWSGLHVKGWTNDYTAWELCGNAAQADSSAKSLYWRSGRNDAWSGWKTILDSNNYASVLDGRYVTLGTAQTISGEKTFSVRMISSKTTSTYLAGNQGQAIINSTAAAGSYTMLAKMNSTNGYFTHGTYGDRYELHYTAKSTVDAGTNGITKNLTLLNESGNSYFPGTINAASFIKSGGTSSQVLNADGSVTTKHGLSTVTNLGWSGTAGQITTINTLAYWNGQYSSGASNLQYCDRGRFGTMATATATDYLARSGGSMTNTNVVTNMNADLLDGHHGSDYLRSFWTNSPGYDCSMITNRRSFCTFTYSNNAPFTGGFVDINANGYGFYLGTSYNFDAPLYYRRHGITGDGGMGSWQQLARISDNVASATKLATARTLWGQSFDGSGNVDGILTVNHGGTAGIYLKSSSGESSYSCQATGGSRWVMGGYATQFFIWGGSAGNVKLAILNNGDVGIGTTSPQYKLHVAGSIRADSWLRTSGATGWYNDSYGGGWYMQNTSYIENFGSKRVKISGISDYYGIWLNGSGLCCEGYAGTSWNQGHGAVNVGIENNTVQTPLLVAYRKGSATAHTGNDRMFAIELLNTGEQLNISMRSQTVMQLYPNRSVFVPGGIWSDGYVSARGQNTSSDERLKNLLKTITLSTRDIANAPSVLFTWKKDGRVDVGSIAQYWERLMPQLAPTDFNGYKTLQYGKAALLASISNARKILSLEKRVARLEAENKELRKKIELLTA